MLIPLYLTKWWFLRIKLRIKLLCFFCENFTSPITFNISLVYRGMIRAHCVMLEFLIIAAEFWKLLIWSSAFLTVKSVHYITLYKISVQSTSVTKTLSYKIFFCKLWSVYSSRNWWKIKAIKRNNNLSNLLSNFD